VLDMIGAARPSIADPFLPKKIEEGRFEDIRECIGCNVCVTGDLAIAPIRCTQNPSMGEEWRRGWHPERIRPKGGDGRVLVVGAGPAGLEAAMMLGRRGYEVLLAEATDALGGRVAREARLPGLAAWIRVLDYRKSQLERLSTVELAFNSRLDADEIAGYEFDHVAVATGARWRADGVGRLHTHPIPLDSGMQVLTPDSVMDGAAPRGPRVVLFDDDHYSMGGVLAEQLARAGLHVTLVTPAPGVSQWTHYTMEQERIQRRLMEMDVVIEASHGLVSAEADGVTIACGYTDRERRIECDSLLLVTARLPNDSIVTDLLAHDPGAQVKAVGDAWSPGTIAAAVWEGRRYAEELDEPDDEPAVRREVVALAPR
jgi:dimethylamine/trimethylamine dehydrogenase